MTDQSTTKPQRRFAREPKPATSAGNVEAAETAPAPRETKIGKVIGLLKREQGASLDEIVTATVWQPHTARSALTGLKKKGHTIERSKDEGGSRYSIKEPRP